jgi:hypothetical protein
MAAPIATLRRSPRTRLRVEVRDDEWQEEP